MPDRSHLFIILSLSLPLVSGQGRFLDDLLRMRYDQEALDKEAIKKLLEGIAAAVFGPHDSDQVEHWSGVFLLQEQGQGGTREQLYRERFNRTGNNIEFNMYDFRQSNEDDSPVSAIFNEELRLVEELEAEGRDPLEVSRPHLESMLSSVFSLPRNHERDQELKEEVGGYIWAKLGVSGLVTGVQSFQVGGGAPRGNNILGLLPGRHWGTVRDRVVVVGAHWDTVRHTGGLDDNGSGAAALLELARALSQGNCSNNNTVILAHFDLEEMGGLGSIEFVQEFLLPRILLDPQLRPRCEFSGAVILDCVLNYNNTNHSQDIEEDWATLVPTAANNIVRNKKRGNFIAAFGRNLPSDQHLAETFRNNWNRNNPDKDIDFENFLMQGMERWNNLSVIADHLNLLRSDHSHFWIINNKEFFSSLPAILLSDLGPYRGYMRECYHAECDNFNRNKKHINWDFYTHTVQSLIDSVVQLSESVCSSERNFAPERERNKTEIFYQRIPRPAVVNQDVMQEVETEETNDVTGEIHSKNVEGNEIMVEVAAQIKDTPGPGQTDLEEGGESDAVIEDTILIRPGSAVQHIMVPVLPQFFYPLHPSHAPIRTFPLHFLYRHCFPFCKV